MIINIINCLDLISIIQDGQRLDNGNEWSSK